MTHEGKLFELDAVFVNKWLDQPPPPAGLLEERILELERLGFIDDEPNTGIPSGVRQFALVSLLHRKPPYFVTADDQLLNSRDSLEIRFGMIIISIPEAMMLLKKFDEPSD